jgi:predicted helicase
MDFQQALGKHRSEAASQSGKGRRFERLMANFLKTRQLRGREFRKVWRWSDFPFRDQFSSKDIGIGLVAETLEGGHWAVQRKRPAEGARISKRQADTFPGRGGKSLDAPDGRTARFSRRRWISATNNWNTEAEAELKNRNPPARGWASPPPRARRWTGIRWTGAAVVFSDE